jgi:hypothetical protein
MSFGEQRPGGAVSTAKVDRYAGKRDEMAAINQPVGHAVTVRDAAAACRLSPRTLRRKLTAGEFPNAYKTGPSDVEREGIWMIPVADLEEAGLQPTLVHPTLKNAVRAQSPNAAKSARPKVAPEPKAAPKVVPEPLVAEAAEQEAETDEGDDEPLEYPAQSPQTMQSAAPAADGPTVLELVRSDRFGRLRAELAEAVAAAEIALLRAEAERWRVLADERAQALDRADTALKALTTALGAGLAIQAPAPSPVPAPAPAPPAPAAAAAPAESHAQAQQGDIVAVPPLVRAEAMRYTATLRALHETRRQQNKWWQFWRV